MADKDPRGLRVVTLSSAGSKMQRGGRVANRPEERWERIMEGLQAPSTPSEPPLLLLSHTHPEP